jgi:aromatic-L-amino-acid/L-tryptophan decarboxylase
VLDSDDNLASLDPTDWGAARKSAHRALDKILDHVEGPRAASGWKPVPAAVKERMRGSELPEEPSDLDELIDLVIRDVLPYSMGNSHPGFTGWFIGAGNFAGLLGEFFAAGMNTSVAGYDQAATYVENQLISWFLDLFGLPESGSGVVVSGTSVATLVAVLVARHDAAGPTVRREGVCRNDGLVGYASSGVHNSVPRAFEMAGLGSDALRIVPCTDDHRIDTASLIAAIESDVAAGKTPFLVIGNAGTIDTGAFDELPVLAKIAKDFGAWFHVDGAFGALAALSDSLKPLVDGIEAADSVAFDLHKWPHVPYDAGCVLVREADAHRSTFAVESAYLSRDKRGMADAKPWFPDYGPELSRSFRSLKAWMTIKHYGRRRLGDSIEMCCDLAQRLAGTVRDADDLDLLAPVALNIVCFRYCGGEEDRTPEQLDALNRRIVQDLQIDGRFVPSSTVIDGQTCIRVAIANHRTTWTDLEAGLDAIRSLAQPVVKS